MINRVGSLLPIIVPLLAVMGPGSHSGESHNVIRSRFPQPPPDSDRSDVFISYCEKDQAYLERIEIILSQSAIRESRFTATTWSSQAL